MPAEAGIHEHPSMAARLAITHDPRQRRDSHNHGPAFMPTAAATFGARLAAQISSWALQVPTWHPRRGYGQVAEGNRAASDRPAVEAPTQKSSRAGPLIAFEHLRRPVWAPRDYQAFADEGFRQNAIVYRCVRMIAECAAHVPLLLYDGDQEIEQHPLKDLVRRPNGHQSWPDFMQALVGYLLVSGNAYLEGSAIDGELRELYILRPDRIKVVPGPDGWPEAFDYTVAGRTVRIGGEVVPEAREGSFDGVRSVLHVKLFHPTNDHYGLSPLEAAASAIDLHNTASKWNKALLDNSARPSGAIVYTARDGNLTSEQIERLKSELEAGFQGSANAGRPLLLEGGLDWKAMSLSPKDMDFLEARHAAAREIALALGVPPMLLGIPGDNTYSNLAEAQRTFWRSTVLPLVERVAAELSHWLAPAFPLPAGGERVRVRGGHGHDAIGLALRPDIDTLPALAGEREALWASLEKTSFLTTDEKRGLAGFSPVPAADAKWASEAPANEKFNPNQTRIPAGNPTGGQWANGDGGDDGEGNSVHPVQMRRPRGGGASRAREQYLADLTSQTRAAVDRLREVDPTWREPQSAFSRGDVEGNIRHQEMVRDAANARLAVITRDAVPRTNPSWGVNRLTKEMHDRGFVLQREARGEGLIYRNPLTNEEIRIMERPANPRMAGEYPQKLFFQYYYRYRTRGDGPWGGPIPIPNK